MAHGCVLVFLFVFGGDNLEGVKRVNDTLEVRNECRVRESEGRREDALRTFLYGWRVVNLQCIEGWEVEGSKFFPSICPSTGSCLLLLFVCVLTIFYLAFLVGAKPAFNLAIKISTSFNECSCFCWSDHNLLCIPHECQTRLYRVCTHIYIQRTKTTDGTLGLYLFLRAGTNKATTCLCSQYRPCCPTKISENFKGTEEKFKGTVSQDVRVQAAFIDQARTGVAAGAELFSLVSSPVLHFTWVGISFQHLHEVKDWIRDYAALTPIQLSCLGCTSVDVKINRWRLSRLPDLFATHERLLESSWEESSCRR